MDQMIEKPGMGWLPDYPDFRDYTTEQDDVPSRLKRLGQKDSVKDMLKKVGVVKARAAGVPTSTDVRAWCSPIENQGSLSSSAANAAIGILEYFEKRAFGKYIDASRLFLYKVTRNMVHRTGDTGASLRSTMAALVLFGVPPEEYWPYIVADFDKEPSAFCYAFARS